MLPELKLGFTLVRLALEWNWLLWLLESPLQPFHTAQSFQAAHPLPMLHRVFVEVLKFEKSQFCSIWVKSQSLKRHTFGCVFLVFIPVYAKGKLSESVYKRTCHNEIIQDRSVCTWLVLLSKKHKRICVLSPRSLGSMERSNTFETSSSHSSSRHWVCRLENTHASKILSGWDVFSWVPPQSPL